MAGAHQGRARRQEGRRQGSASKSGGGGQAVQNKARISSGGVGGGATRWVGKRCQQIRRCREEPPIRSLGKCVLVAPIPSRSVSCTKKQFFFNLGKRREGGSDPFVSFETQCAARRTPPPTPGLPARGPPSSAAGVARTPACGDTCLRDFGVVSITATTTPSDSQNGSCRMRAATLLVIALRLL